MSNLPFRTGRADDYRVVREWLTSVGYAPASICARAGVPTLLDFPTRADGRATVSEAGDALDLLIGLFLDGGRVGVPVLERLLPREVRAAMEALGVLDAVHEAPEERAATVSLYPVESLYIASDLSKRSGGVYREEELEPPDFVYSAISSNTGTFLENVPTTPCRRLLELCSGTAAPALLRASRAEHAWAVDLTERATRFAEFNGRLNAVENFTPLRGDLYEPVRGMTFDRILAHPPYVPAADTEMIFRDGGPDGEDVLRRILAGLADHLSPGGCFYGTFRATDRAGAPLEDRLRAMLGPAEAEFDLVLISHYEFAPTEYYTRVASAGVIPFPIVEEKHLLYRKLDAERIVYTSIVLQRHERARETFTLRRARGTQAGWREAEWLRWWGTTCSTGDWRGLLLDSRPVLSPVAELDVHYGVEKGDWQVKSCDVRSERPFPRTVRLSHPMAALLTAYDGSLTVREQVAQMRAAGALPPELPDEVFLGSLRDMVLEGVLELDDARPHDLVEIAQPGT